MKEWFDSLPVEAAVACLWAIGIIRTSIVFLLGYLAAAGGARLSRIREAMNTPIYQRATAFVNRWGVLAVPLCFLTVGFQTAVIITTGFTKMSLRRWVPAMLVGTFIWAVIYTTVGFAVLAALGLQPWMLPVALAVIVLLSLGISKVRELITDRKPRP